MSESAGNALISVFDKTGIVEFASGLSELDWRIYASGGTARVIEGAGVPVVDVAELVGGEAILGHRVVTLSREISAGVLADKNSKEDMAEMKALKIPLIDLVCVDPYPLEEAVAKADADDTSVLFDTDIGGPTLLREAAKGRRIVLSVAEQRQQVLNWLRAGKPDEAKFLRSLAARAVYEVARYTAIEAQYWNGADVSITVARKQSQTKYGENPQQADAGLYADNRINIDPLGIDQFKHVKGWQESFINETDMERLLQTSTHIAAGYERNFGDVPAMAIGVKHGNACGAAVATTHLEAIKKMLDGDTRAIFGGVVMVNGEIDETVAQALMWHANKGDKARLLDGVVGASVTDEALEILSREKLRVVIDPALATLTEASLDQERRKRYVRGAVLEQDNYTFVMDIAADYMEQHGEVSDQQKRDLILAWAIGSTSNSNTITLAKNGMLIGNGVGQQDRVGAGQLALSRTTIAIPELEDLGDKLVMHVVLDKSKLDGAVAYSDSFFPYEDGPTLLAQAGIKAMLTSSSAARDKFVIADMKKLGVSLLMVPDKIGRGFYAH